MAQYPERPDDQPLAVNGGMVIRDPAQIESLLQQVAATGNILLTGSEHDGDTLTVTFHSQQLPGGSHSIEVVTAGAESLAAIATAIANAINADPLLSGLGMPAATTNGANVIPSWIPGPLGNFATMTFGNSGTTELATITQFAGGAGYIVPQQDADVVINGSMLQLKYQQPRLVSYNQLKAILSAGVTVK